MVNAVPALNCWPRPALLRGSESNATNQYIQRRCPVADRRGNGILYTNTRIGTLSVGHGSSGFDAGNFKSTLARDRRYPGGGFRDRRGDEPGALR